MKQAISAWHGKRRHESKVVQMIAALAERTSCRAAPLAVGQCPFGLGPLDLPCRAASGQQWFFRADPGPARSSRVLPALFHAAVALHMSQQTRQEDKRSARPTDPGHDRMIEWSPRDTKFLCSSCSAHVAIQLKGLRIPRNDSSRAVHQREKYTPY